MRVRIWGARGSIPSPLRPEEVREKIISAIVGISQVDDEGLKQELSQAIWGEITATGDQTVEPDALAKRRQIVAAYLETLSPLLSSTASSNTPCVEVRTDQEIFIIDAGSGIRDLGLALMAGPCGQGQGVIHLLFSHPHWDHIQGLPFFEPLYMPGNRITFYSRRRDGFQLSEVIHKVIEDPYFPLSHEDWQAHVSYVEIEDGETREIAPGIRMASSRLNHPLIASAYRIDAQGRSFVYVTDTAPFDHMILDREFIPRAPDLSLPVPPEVAETLGAVGETDAALGLWRQVTEQHSYARARVQLAELLLARNLPDEARRVLTEVLEDDPHTPAFQRQRDRVWVRRAKALLRRLD